MKMSKKEIQNFYFFIIRADQLQFHNNSYIPQEMIFTIFIMAIILGKTFFTIINSFCYFIFLFFLLLDQNCSEVIAQTPSVDFSGKVFMKAETFYEICTNMCECVMLIQCFCVFCYMYSLGCMFDI